MKMSKIALASVTAALGIVSAYSSNSYQSAVNSLGASAYWPLNETTQPPAAFVVTNRGTLGSAANGFYCNPPGHPTSSTLFPGPTNGATSDGNPGALCVGQSGDIQNVDGYVIVPNPNRQFKLGVPFTSEVWVKPLGGDPNDITGASYASTEWAAVMKSGAGGQSFNGVNGNGGGDANEYNKGDGFGIGNSYGWCVSLAGYYTFNYSDGNGGWQGWDGSPGLISSATWIVDFYNGESGNRPTLEMNVPMSEPTPAWFHLVLSYDGTNAFFYTNGVIAATTVPGIPQSTNTVMAPDPNGWNVPDPTGLNTFTSWSYPTNDGVRYKPDLVNPICFGNINPFDCTHVNQGGNGPNANQGIGFNSQTFYGVLDEAALYTNVLSPAAVAQHYAYASSTNHTLYTNAVISANPVIYLRFDEPHYTQPNSASFPVAACTSNKFNGVYQPGTIPGIAGVAAEGFGSPSRAVKLNGLDGAIVVANIQNTVLDPQGASPFSVTAWFKGNLADCYGRFQSILGRGDNAWRFAMDYVANVHWNPGNGPELVSTNTYNDGNWHMIVGTSDGSTAALYVDGQIQDSSTGVGSLGGSSNDLLIGGAPDYTSANNSGGQTQRYFAGQVAQVAFFNKTLSSQDVTSLYQAVSFAVNIQSLGAGQIQLTWDSGTLVSSSTVSGVYSPVAGTSPLTLPVSGSAQFFRLQ